MRRKLFIYLTELIFTVIFVVPLQTQAMDRPDFDRDREAAKEFGNNKEKEFIDRLNDEEKEIYNNKIKDYHTFNAVNSNLRAKQEIEPSSQQNKLIHFLKEQKEHHLRDLFIYTKWLQK